ncbi:hypothetical protein BN946_scf184756.g15 [Trametes cinnabarina]|uniref:Methyltransferase domain-containing protein n=1 Tax=Pycnoporus cinnabarinus TaxID=5643 RepID=A0A060SE30_PYCCI|nr:hypothetical protein BN946_scf184756.g15 [Trametes cinnabarina]
MAIPQNPQNGVSRDVQDELLNAQSDAQKQRLKATANPVKCHKSLAFGDDWTTMLFRHMSHGVTMHEFERPPDSVLDLGCGTGLWAIEAAKFWPHCRVVGFDKLAIQPDLTQVKLGIDCRELSERVKWVHGDFLDRLPFEDDQFEFVRICNIGLAVPEIFWQDLLLECSRVLKPGGCIEIMEEDLIFPAGRTRKPDEIRTSTAHSLRQPSGDQLRKESMASQLTAQTSQTMQTSTTASSSSHPKQLYTTEHISQNDSMDSYISSSTHSGSEARECFVQDHEKLKEAWMEMLGQRFLTHKLLNVLPFYLSSAFKTVIIHPTIHVVLPPPSGHRGPRVATAAPMTSMEAQDPNFTNWVQDMRSHVVRLSASDGPQKANPAALRSSKSSGTRVTLWSALHLARQYQLVSACKEAIWDAYCTLTGAARQTFLAPGEASRELRREDLREEFEREWAAWERSRRPASGLPRYRERRRLLRSAPLPDQRNGSASLHAGSAEHQVPLQQHPPQYQPMKNPDWNHSEELSLCRSMRGFIAWKPAA